MTRQVTTLLAVVALAAPGCERAPAQAPAPAGDPWQATARVDLAVAGPELATSIAMASAVLTAALPARPRCMESGAPACGNVAARVPAADIERGGGTP